MSRLYQIENFVHSEYPTRVTPRYSIGIGVNNRYVL
jgi:hypothetical protein